jgi:hypothetical protein
MARPSAENQRGVGGVSVQNRVQSALASPKPLVSLGYLALIICLKGRYASKLAHMWGDMTQLRGDGVSLVSSLSVIDKKSVRFAITCAY